MNRVKSILRVVFLLLTVLQLVYLNRKAENHSDSIAEFKFKMIEKIRTDTLDSKHKLDLLLNETKKYVDNSSHVREGIHYLMGWLGLWGAIELAFLILQKRNDRQ